jgi:hypothetical protein
MAQVSLLDLPNELLVAIVNHFGRADADSRGPSTATPSDTAIAYSSVWYTRREPTLPRLHLVCSRLRKVVRPKLWEVRTVTWACKSSANSHLRH